MIVACLDLEGVLVPEIWIGVAQEEIHEGALRIAERVLKRGGTLILKGFPGPESDSMRKLLRKRFTQVSEVRPEGKRGTSKEFYWVAR